MTITKDPFGKWSKPVNIRPGAGWIDPCPFWDDDGKAYLVAGVAKSRIGYKSVLHMVEMQPDGMGLIGEEVKIFDGNENDQVTIEGPKMYKRNGWYYVFAPAGGVKTGWQTVLRSKNPFGPYEYKVVMRQGDSPVNGPHQGAWVDTVTGQDWFLHFQDVYAGGRIVHLQPMHWENDWPIIGISRAMITANRLWSTQSRISERVIHIRFASRIRVMTLHRINSVCSGSGMPIPRRTGMSLPDQS